MHLSKSTRKTFKDRLYMKSAVQRRKTHDLSLKNQETLHNQKQKHIDQLIVNTSSIKGKKLKIYDKRELVHQQQQQRGGSTATTKDPDLNYQNNSDIVSAFLAYQQAHQSHYNSAHNYINQQDTMRMDFQHETSFNDLASMSQSNIPQEVMINIQLGGVGKDSPIKDNAKMLKQLVKSSPKKKVRIRNGVMVGKNKTQRDHSMVNVDKPQLQNQILMSQINQRKQTPQAKSGAQKSDLINETANLQLLNQKQISNDNVEIANMSPDQLHKHYLQFYQNNLQLQAQQKQFDAQKLVTDQSQSQYIESQGNELSRQQQHTNKSLQEGTLDDSSIISAQLDQYLFNQPPLVASNPFINQQPFSNLQYLQQQRPATSIPYSSNYRQSSRQQGKRQLNSMNNQTLQSNIPYPFIHAQVINQSLTNLQNSKQAIDECFPTNLKRLATGNIQKAFVKPINFKYGAQFRTKSEEARYYKVSTQILKLRHLLVNDPSRSHDYIFKFLKHYFTLEEISKFTDEGLKNFIHAIIEFRIANPNHTVQEFILESMKGGNKDQNNNSWMNIDNSLCQIISTESQSKLISMAQIDTNQVSQQQLVQSNPLLLPDNAKQTLQLMDKANTFMTSAPYHEYSDQPINKSLFVKSAKRANTTSKKQPFISPIQSTNIKLFDGHNSAINTYKNMRSRHKNTKSVMSQQRRNGSHFTTRNAMRFATGSNLTVNDGGQLGEVNMMYSPLSGKHEFFVKNPNIPKLDDNYLESPQKIIRDYINQQDIRLAKEIEPPSCRDVLPNKECQLTLVNDIEGYNPQIKEIKSRQTKDGIMRRNKLLLEHILHERLEKSISTINYYQGTLLRKKYSRLQDEAPFAVESKERLV